MEKFTPATVHTIASAVIGLRVDAYMALTSKADTLRRRWVITYDHVPARLTNGSDLLPVGTLIATPSSANYTEFSSYEDAQEALKNLCSPKGNRMEVKLAYDAMLNLISVSNAVVSACQKFLDVEVPKHG